MKLTNLTRFSTARGQRGNVLIMAIIFGAIVGVILISYLSLVKARTNTRARSLAWNSAIPVLEAGLEEAFTHLNDDAGHLTTNRWTSSGSGAALVYQKTRTNSDKSYCIVTLSNAATTTPTIYSHGFVPAPLAAGYISRLVQISVTNPIAFTKAIAARSTVTLGGGAVVDSFDSSNTNYSTGGQYDAAKRRANGGVVTDSTAAPAISVGTGRVYGLTDTGPGGTVTTSGGGAVGDLAWAGSGIQSGYANDDMNVAYPTNSAPTGYTLWLPPTIDLATAAYQGTNYTYAMGNVSRYALAGYTLTGGQSLVVTGAATLYINGDFTVAGNSFIYIAPGGSLTVYVANSSNSSIAGGGIINGTGLAANFSYVGLATNTKLSYSGNASFVGTINAPQADVSISGGASLVGAAIANTFTVTGGSNVHYDEGLGALGRPKLLAYREL